MTIPIKGSPKYLEFKKKYEKTQTQTPKGNSKFAGFVCHLKKKGDTDGI